MSIAAVTHKHVFGLKGSVKDNIHYVDEQTIVYPAGANAILYNFENKTQKVLSVSEHGDAITAMALCSNKRFLAVALTANQPTVIIFDMQTLRKRKVLFPTDCESKEFVSLAFSADGKHILTQTGAPDWRLYLWSWEKTKLVGSVRVNSTAANAAAVQSSQPSDESPEPTTASAASTGSAAGGRAGTRVHQVAFNLADSSQFSVVGHGVFRMYRFSEGAIKPCGGIKCESRNYLCHAWLNDDRVVLGTECGRIYIYQSSGDLYCELKNASSNAQQTPRSVHAVAAVARGFYTAGDGGAVMAFEKSDEVGTTGREIYRKVHEVLLPDDPGVIVNMAVSPTEDALALCTTTNQIFSVSVAAPDLTAAAAAAAPAASSTGQTGTASGGAATEEPAAAAAASSWAAAGGVLVVQAKTDQFTQLFHHGQILGMDVCVRKPLVVTCSNDRSVRVWNYADSSIEIVKQFNEDALSASIHPSGLYLLVGFSDKLRLMNVLMDDIRPFREFSIRSCPECRFSNGGQYFAAVHGNAIQIYNTWTFENLANLKGHNGKVRNIHWADDDLSLITAGMEGAIYHWSLRDLFSASGSGIKRQGENILKSCAYTCAVLTPGGRTTYAVGSDSTLKELVDSQITRTFSSGTVLTQVAMGHSGHSMFLGTVNGTIRAVKYPLAGDAGPTGLSDGLEFHEHQAHAGAVTKLRVSFDDQYLFSVAADGCLYVFRVFDREMVRVGNGPATAAAVASAQADFASGGTVARKDREVVFADEILVTRGDLDEKRQAEQELRSRIEEVKMEHEYQLRLKDLNFNEKIKETMEKYEQEIEALHTSTSILRSEKEKEALRFQEEVSQEKEHHARELLDLETAHNAHLMAEYEKYQELQVRAGQQQAQWEQQFKELQEQNQAARAEMQHQFEKQLRERQLELEGLEKSLAQQTLEYEEVARETEEDADTEVNNLKVRYETKLREEKEIGLRLKGENAIMRKKFNTLQSEIESRKADIARMVTEEKKYQSLIKSLERDIQGLKREIQERDDTVQDKERRIYDLKKKNQELDKFKFVLDYKIKELKRQIEPREQDIHNMTAQIKEMDVELQKYNHMNTLIELNISDIKLKVQAAEKEVAKERSRYKACQAIVNRFKLDLSECMKHIQDPQQLKQALKGVYHKYCQARGISVNNPGGKGKLSSSNDDVTVSNTDRVAIDAQNGSSEVDLGSELTRQRQHLERAVAGLRDKIAKDQRIHRLDTIQIVNENTVLIKELNQLRRELRAQKAAEAHAAGFTKLPPLHH